MLKGIIGIVSIAALFFACSKSNNNTPEAQLYGTWSKGTKAGDTLWFMQKDGKNIMRSNQSFNYLYPAYLEEEYTFTNGVLNRLYTTSAGSGSFSVNSFTWTQTGQEFSITGIEVYMFMNSTATKFTFKKID